MEKITNSGTGCSTKNCHKCYKSNSEQSHNCSARNNIHCKHSCKTSCHSSAYNTADNLECSCTNCQSHDNCTGTCHCSTEKGDFYTCFTDGVSYETVIDTCAMTTINSAFDIDVDGLTYTVSLDSQKED